VEWWPARDDDNFAVTAEVVDAELGAYEDFVMQV